MVRSYRRVVWTLLAASVAGAPMAMGQDYRKATEGKEVVMNKIYPKRSKVELSLPNVGIILNQSYVNSYFVSGGINYFWAEEWGLGVDFSMALNKDKPERYCIENFFNDPNNQVPASCPEPGQDGAELLKQDSTNSANYGPAYVPIRELQYVATVNAIWNPVYGKQLILLSTTSYFDLFFEIGGGIATSKYYPKQEFLANGNKSRGQFGPKGENPPPGGAPLGARPDETDSYGVDGRPLPVAQNHPIVNIGIGQKFHFARRFHFKMYLRNFTLLGTPSGFENIFALYGGFGVRF